MNLSTAPNKLTVNEVKEYRNCYLHGVMDIRYIAKEKNIVERSVSSFLANQTYQDVYYQKLLKKIKNGYKTPIEMPLKKKLTEPLKRVLNNYEISIIKQAEYLKNNLCNITYENQLALFIEGENNPEDKYLFVIEKSIGTNFGYLVPKDKYSVLLTLEKNREYFSKFLYEEKDGIRIKRISNFEDYWITEDGRIISTLRGKILTNYTNKKGYCQILLPTKEGKKYTHKVHRLVAEAFIVNEFDKPQVNHKDGVKTNNYYTNLEWCNNQENQIHARDNGLLIAKFGEESNASKLTKEQVKTIRELYSTKQYTHKNLGEMYNVSSTTIYFIVKNMTYKDNNYFKEGVVSAIVQKETKPSKLEIAVR